MFTLPSSWWLITLYGMTVGLAVHPGETSSFIRKRCCGRPTRCWLCLDLTCRWSFCRVRCFFFCYLNTFEYFSFFFLSLITITNCGEKIYWEMLFPIERLCDFRCRKTDTNAILNRRGKFGFQEAQRRPARRVVGRMTVITRPTTPTASLLCHFKGLLNIFYTCSQYFFLRWQLFWMMAR